MLKTKIVSLPHYLTARTILNKISPLGNAVCLSGSWGQQNTKQRYDIFSAAPSIQLSQLEDSLDIKNKHGKTQEAISSFDWLENYFEKNRTSYSCINPDNSENKLPFIFGFIGYVSYDYGRQLEDIPIATINDTNIPDLCGGIYHWNLVNDKQNKKSYLAFGPLCSDELKASVLNALDNKTTPATPCFKLATQFKQDSPYEFYQNSFKRIDNYINSGDCYQVNYSHRHKAQYKGCPAEAYTLLDMQLGTPFSAYLQFDDHQILSLSPERFIKVRGNQAETKPIKGTIRRGKTSEEDERLIERLKKSTKDRAENLMIVDLLRNDLNKTCLPGTVKTPTLFDIETYPNVHHMVSTVTGMKPSGTTPFEVLKQAFPGGSITGAPKIRAMEIIEELETHRRSIYCGSIFYVGFDGNMDSNICIRTLLCKNDTIYCWGGGGIVADSTCEDEYQESITKIKNLMDSLEGINREM